MRLIKSKDIHVNEYAKSYGLNPEYVFYERVSPITTNNSYISFEGETPSKDALLLNYLPIRWNTTITKRVDTGGRAATNYEAGDKLTFKPFCPMSYCMSKVQFNINGTNLDIFEPRHISKVIGLAYGKSVSKGHLSTAGGEFPDFEGHYVVADSGGSPANMTGGGNFVVRRGDYGDEKLERAIDRFRDLIQRSTAYAGTAATIAWEEPLIYSLFSPFLHYTDNLPKDCPFKNLSPVIPSVDTWKLDINIDPINGGFYEPICGVQNSGDPKMTTAVLNNTTEAILYWYVPQDGIPQELSAINPKGEYNLPCFDMVRFDVPVPTNNAVSDGAGGTPTILTFPRLAIDTTYKIRSNLMLLKDIPDLFILHFEVNKADYDALYPTFTPIYGGEFKFSFQDEQGQQLTNIGQKSIFDDHLEISNLSITLRDNARVINAEMNQEELYNLTRKNCGSEMVHNFYQWRGSAMFTVASSGFSSQCFVVLRPEDLSEKLSPGMNKSGIQLYLECDVTPRGGYGPSIAYVLEGDASETGRDYTGHLHCVYNKKYININPTSAKYKTQSII